MFLSPIESLTITIVFLTILIIGIILIYYEFKDYTCCDLLKRCLYLKRKSYIEI